MSVRRSQNATPANVEITHTSQPLNSPDTAQFHGGGRMVGTVLATGPLSSGITFRRTLPGRAKKRGRASSDTRRSRRRSWLRFCFASEWCQDLITSYSSLLVAITLWYLLGVVSIASSKIFLSWTRASPICLTLLQFAIGASLLSGLLRIRFLGSPGYQPLSASPFSPRTWTSHLALTGIFFSLGFLATNFAFSQSSAAFVETIKAAEPLTSASIAMGWGIEVLSRNELISLAAIVSGVLLSTWGNQRSSAAGSWQESLITFLIVMTSNLCFSFRGLFQKLLLLRARDHDHPIVQWDDLNLQYRMQLTGVCLLTPMVVFFHSASILSALWHTPVLNTFRILVLALLNGCAFTGYNLASTYILNRISVVHHAALNCIRRVFAVVVTSLVFQIPITVLGILGILMSVGGFMGFTHFKVQRQLQPKPLSSLLPVSEAHASLP